MSFFNRYQRQWHSFRQLFRLLRLHRLRILFGIFLGLAIGLGGLIIPIEARYENANIRTFEEGIWWSVTTLTGVGYGDFYPVSTTGRMLGMVQQVLGLLIFGLMTGYIVLVLFRSRDEYYWKKLFREIDDLHDRLDRMERNQRFLVKENALEAENNCDHAHHQTHPKKKKA